MRTTCLPALAAKAMLINAMGAGLALALPAGPAAAQQWRELTCESWNYREASCPAPGAVRVQLLRVRGGNCVEGESWIHDGSAIRVRKGCRAVFRIDASNGWGVGGWDPNPDGGGRWQVLRCESWNYRNQRCAVEGVIGGARLLRVIAGDCRDGETWRWDRRAITVRNGCRADFEVRRSASSWGDGGNWGGGSNQPAVSVTCESWNFRPAQCAIGRARQVRLNRVLGGSCVEGRSWGQQGNRIWVKDGCRARFDVY